MSNQAQKTGLFLANYQIGESIPGGIIFQTHFVVDAVNKTVSGYGSITQATNPPLDIKTELKGDYTYMTVMPNQSHILITAQGYPNFQFPKGAGIGPVILPNVELRMVLSSDWKTGTASYKYYINGTIEPFRIEKEVKNAKVTLLSSNQFELSEQNIKAAEQQASSAQSKKKAFG